MLTIKDKKKRYNKKSKVMTAHTFEGLSVGDKLGIAGLAIQGAQMVGDAIGAGVNAAQLQGVEEAKAEIDQQKNFQSAATDNDSLLNEWSTSKDIRTDYTASDFLSSSGDFAKQQAGNIIKNPLAAISAGFGRLAARGKAKRMAAQMNEKARQANVAKTQTFIAKAGALDQANDQRALAAYAAYGGDINAPKFSMFPSEVTEFNTGGSHEENPYDGIPQGIAPDGLPNLVEEGEVKYDNYIFSDRLMLNKEDKNKYKFLKGKTYADAAKAIKKELGIDERPNDLIAKTDLAEHLNILSTLQEEERAKRGLRGENRMMYKDGGHIFNGRKSTITSYMDDGFTRKEARQAYKLGVDPWDLYDPTLSDDNMKGGANKLGDSSSWLQAAPAIGNAIGVLTQAFNRPDYKHAKELQQSNEEFTPISYTPLTQKMEYKPFDVNYYGNKLGAQAGATRRAIREQTASNPYAATAALLSADANTQSQMGDLYRKAEEYNLAQREKVNTFNRATDSANAEMAMKTAQLNSSLKDRMYSRQLERDAMAAKLKMMEDQAWSQSMSTSMTSMFNNLGDIAKQKMSKEMANDYILGQIRANGFDLIDGKLVPVKKAHGGKLTTRNTRKNKKGFTV